jgi:glycosyltransferase involved in cell wall biosynthesis
VKLFLIFDYNKFMRIGFLNNQICERGSTWQAYLYAKYARAFFGHSTVMLYPTTRYMFDHSKWTRTTRLWLSHFSSKQREKIRVHYDPKMAERIVRDGVEIIQARLDVDFSQFDAIHHFKYGRDDKFRPKGTRYWVHAVFDASQPHGERYAAVSRWLGQRDKAPFVPNLVERPDDFEDLRTELRIPTNAVVFGRYGARDTFDIPWVWNVISEIVAQSENIFFLFANTDVKIRHEQVLDLPTIYDGEVPLEIKKRRFVNTCDAMLHARERGETFGIAVGEFAVCGKPVLTYAQSSERSHIDMLTNPILYNDATELKRAIEMVVSKEAPPETGGAYLDCTPEKLMQKFNQVFIQ